MNKWLVRLAVPVLASAFVVAGFAFQHQTASAYGRADQPLAQIEFSGNCDNPNFFFCSDVVGTGGIWFWIEIDADGTGDIAGSECFHTVGGVGGPGGAGAQSIKGDVTWENVHVEGDPSSAYPQAALPGMVDPNGDYYLITIPGGDEFLFPRTTGHYSAHPDHGVTLQLQIAP